MGGALVISKIHSSIPVIEQLLLDLPQLNSSLEHKTEIYDSTVYKLQLCHNPSMHAYSESKVSLVKMENCYQTQ